MTRNVKDWLPVFIFGMCIAVLLSNMVFKRWAVTLAIWAVILIAAVLVLSASSPHR